MQSLTKTQVLALFLGVASAGPESDFLKSLSDSANFADSSNKVLKGGSAAACNAVGGCAAAGEKCGAFQTVGVADAVNFCVNEVVCGIYGRMAGKDFSVQCWKEVKAGETPTKPDTVDATKGLAAIEETITKTTLSWKDEKDLVVSSEFNYLDGWWTKNKDGKWVETDKPADNRCFLDLQCDATQCCMLWPDLKNRRCGLKTLDKVTQTRGPMTFTPQCQASSGNADQVPENAKDDIAAGALSQANDELDKFFNLQLADAKKAANYDDAAKCDAACKEAFDKAEKAKKDKREAFWKELKATANYDDKAKCDDQCKATFQADLLKWEKQVFETCNLNAKAVACTDAQEIKKAVEKERAAGDKSYYVMEKADRETFDKAQLERTAKVESSITALQAPKVGEEFFPCVKTEDKVDATKKLATRCGADGKSTTQCCGLATPKSGDKIPITVCLTNTKGATKDAEDKFGRGFSHQCFEGAMKIASSVAAAGIALYYM